MTFMADNTLNNDTLIDELSILVPSFGGHGYHVHCFAHILNLMVKVSLLINKFMVVVLKLMYVCLMFRQYYLNLIVNSKQS